MDLPFPQDPTGGPEVTAGGRLRTTDARSLPRRLTRHAAPYAQAPTFTVAHTGVPSFPRPPNVAVNTSPLASAERT